VSEATSDVSTGAHGPVDFLLLEFPAAQLHGAVAPELVRLVESGIIRLYDLMVISKDENGAVEALELRDSPVAHDFAYFAGASSGLLGDDDMREAAEAMRPGTVAALLVYENSWAAPFVSATRSSGGEVIAGGRIPASVVMEVLDELEALDGADSTTR
jgi:uncharacterized membrane protein